MGNSEVGHLNLGAGRVVYQDSTRISKAIREGDFFKNQVLLSAMNAVKQKGRTPSHGLLSDGGVHSRLDHIFALIDMAKAHGITNVFFHAFLDGRDTPPSSALEYITSLESHFSKIGIGRIASVSGRYYAMDRDKRWERVQKAYEALVLGRRNPEVFGSRKRSSRAMKMAGPTSSCSRRSLWTATSNRPLATIKDGDAVIFCNFRSDRAREITQALTDPEFDGFQTAVRPSSFVLRLPDHL